MQQKLHNIVVRQSTSLTQNDSILAHAERVVNPGELQQLCTQESEDGEELSPNPCGAGSRPYTPIISRTRRYPIKVPPTPHQNTLDDVDFSDPRIVENIRAAFAVLEELAATRQQ